jgi:hypothetical protein
MLRSEEPSFPQFLSSAQIGARKRKFMREVKMSEDKVEPTVVEAVGNASTGVSPLTAMEIQNSISDALVEIQTKSDEMWKEVLEIRKEMAEAEHLTDRKRERLQARDDELCKVIAEMNSDDAKRAAVARARYIARSAHNALEAEARAIADHMDLTPREKEAQHKALMSGDRLEEFKAKAAKEFAKMQTEKE